jgi:hypothetical protein
LKCFMLQAEIDKAAVRPSRDHLNTHRALA